MSRRDSTLQHRKLLDGLPCLIQGQGVASEYANSLLHSLGATVSQHGIFREEHPALVWARCGLMALTGEASGPTRMCPVPLASCADGVIKALAAVANGQARSGESRLPISGAALLGERAAIAGLSRQGATSPGGTCRLLRSSDGWLALNLARNDDWNMLSAWLESQVDPSWEAVAAAIATRATCPLLERGRLMGLALAESGSPQVPAPPWFSLSHEGKPAAPRGKEPLVIDLSSLWAGPLCAHLLQILGARVIKVESSSRADGARQGPADFHNLLNAGKTSVALDFASHGDLARLEKLLTHADIVIEASRPRAMRQLGISAERLLAAKPGLTWLSISGYGRGEEQASWVAFGDDAGVAAGLSGLLLDLGGEPLICCDAIADPLAGMHAALAAWSSYIGGGGNLLSISLHDVAAHCIGFSLPGSRSETRARWLSWQTLAQKSGLAETRPTARPTAGTARPLGVDTASVLSEFGIPC